MSSTIMFTSFKFSILFLLVVLLCCPSMSSAETADCRRAYLEGGAMGVVRSPDCPRWFHPLSWAPHTDPNIIDCSDSMLHSLSNQFSTYDDIFCDIDLMFPYRGLNGVQKEATLGIVAVFNRHTSNEDTKKAWTVLQDLFFLHTYFLFNGTYVGRLQGTLPDNDDGSIHIRILKEALLRAIHDIDLAFPKNGNTATIILMVDDQIFITSYDESYERIPEPAAGSYTGSLAASRSVCEVSFTRLGVVSPINMTDSHVLSSNGSCLEARLSIQLKTLMSQGLCDALRETFLHEGSKLSSSCTYLFKDSMVNAAFE